MELHLILLIVAISATEALAQYFLQKNSDTKGNTPMYLAAGVIVYGLVAYIYNLMFRRQAEKLRTVILEHAAVRTTTHQRVRLW